MKNQLTNVILEKIMPFIDNLQAKKILEILDSELNKYEIKEKINTIENSTVQNSKILDAFISAKKIEGCSVKTLRYYKATIEALLNHINKDIRRILTTEIRDYLTTYQQTNNVSRVTVDNVRRILSSFFSWLEDEEYIIKSPIRRIHKIKSTISVKETYSDEVVEMLRDNCSELRDLAIIDMLISTGMRVGEMVKLNKQDVNFADRECVVFGKGSKERIVYFDAKTKLHLKKYLASRTDDNPALFVSLRAPYNRLSIIGIEVRLKNLGRKLGISKVHPHKFRRTLATMAIDKGMPIEQLQHLLGHQRIDTTLQYAMVKQSNVKIAHKRFIS